MITHTKGPWKIKTHNARFTGVALIVNEQDEVIAKMEKAPGMGIDEFLANVELVASAPELVKLKEKVDN